MRFRNAVHITMDNFSNVFKTLLYRLITGIVFFSLTYVILKMGLSSILNSAEMDHVKDLIGGFLKALFTGQTETLQAFQQDFPEAVKELGVLVGKNTGPLVGSIIGVCIMYLLSRFVNGLSVFAVGGVLNDRMSVFARTGFCTSCLRNIGKGALYQLIYVPFCFAYDVIMLLVCWFFFFFVLSHLFVWGVFTVLIALALTMAAIICLEALKMTVISAWMPGILCGGLSVTQAFRKSFCARKHFGRRFATYLAAVMLIVVVNVSFALCTFGSALLVTMPLSYLFLLCIQFVQYYEDNEQKYFISFRKIAGGDDTPQGVDE